MMVIKKNKDGKRETDPLLNLHLTWAIRFRLQRRASVGSGNITVDNDVRSRTVKRFATMLVSRDAGRDSSGGGSNVRSSRFKRLICIQETPSSYLGRNTTYPKLERVTRGQTDTHDETSRLFWRFTIRNASKTGVQTLSKNLAATWNLYDPEGLQTEDTQN